MATALAHLASSSQRASNQKTSLQSLVTAMTQTLRDAQGFRSPAMASITIATASSTMAILAERCVLPVSPGSVQPERKCVAQGP